MVPKFIPKIQRPELIPKPLVFPGIGHLFPKDLERLLCPVRALGLYIVRSANRAKEDPHQKLFVHFSPDTQLFTTHFRRWVVETIRLTYEISSQSDLPKIRAHDVRVVAASIPYYRNTPITRAIWTYRMEILQCFRPTLPEIYGSQYRAPGPSYGGCTYGPPLEICPSTHCSPPPPMCVNFGILSMAGGNIR